MTIDRAVSSNFLWVSVFWRTYEEKNRCAAGEPGGCKPSSVASRNFGNFGYFTFWIAQKEHLVGLVHKGHLSIFRWINCYTFESLGVWVWDPKLVYRLQNSSGYGTDRLHHNMPPSIFQNNGTNILHNTSIRLEASIRSSS